MDKITTHLVELADSLDKAGNIKCSNTVDDLIKNQSISKFAQYVGQIGYVLKQNRAMGNCIRKKRITQEGSMQDVVLDCLKEYQDGQDYHNTEWTSKYAQVIEHLPENFETSHMDFISAIAEENQVDDHIAAIKTAHAMLKESGVEDELFEATIADMHMLNDMLKEGDADQRPFKVAAPRSQRGFWSRLLSPSWTGRGVQKDTELEMKNAIEGISGIASAAQQIRSNIGYLRHQAGALQGNENVISAIEKLSPSNWEQTINGIRLLQQSTTNDSRLFSIRDIAHNMAEGVNGIYNQINQLQKNMQTLRQRESVTGHKYGPSASEEYGQLEMALQRLYHNPLNEKALFYSQKLHGRLEDALNMRGKSNVGPDFDNWIGSFEGQEIDPIERIQPEKRETTAPVSSGSPENIAQGLTDLLGADFTNELIRVFEEVAQGDFGTSAQAANLLTMIQTWRTPAMPGENAPPETTMPPEVAKVTPPEELIPNEYADPFANMIDESADYDDENMMDADWSTMRDPRQMMMAAMSRLDTLVKIADMVDEISPEVADIIDEYIQQYGNENSPLPEFPENASILKEDDKIRA